MNSKEETHHIIISGIGIVTMWGKVGQAVGVWGGGRGVPDSGIAPSNSKFK